MLKLLLAGGLALVAMPAAAFADEPKSESKEDKVVCKRVGGTGWRLGGERICKTVREWDGISDESRREARRYQNDVSRAAAGQ